MLVMEMVVQHGKTRSGSEKVREKIVNMRGICKELAWCDVSGGGFECFLH